uniref:Galectin n=1 Tax=Acrobeloides nanus TaxID=290746 RepID=A0A914DSC7_9BILA
MACIVMEKDKECSCGGVVISATIILTAAHCYKPNTSYHVIVGLLDNLKVHVQNTPEGIYKTSNVTFILHPDYTQNKKNKLSQFRTWVDIAIIQVEPPISNTDCIFPNGTLNPNPITPVNFPFDPYTKKIWLTGDKLNVDTKCRVYGYGLMGDEDPNTGEPHFPNRLQYTDLSFRFTPDKYVNNKSRVIIYTDSCNVKQGFTCGSDSGSPLFCEIDGRFELVGIHVQSTRRRSLPGSQGIHVGDCATQRAYMRAVDIRSHKDWIIDTIVNLPRHKGNLENFDKKCWRWDRTIEEKMKCGTKEFILPVHGTFISGTYLLVHGYIPKMDIPDSFEINLINGNGTNGTIFDKSIKNVPLHLKVDFENFILNSKKDGRWAQRPRTLDFAKCKYNRFKRYMEIEIVAKKDRFWIYCNRDILGEYLYEFPLNSIDYIEVKGGFDVYDFDLEETDPYGQDDSYEEMNPMNKYYKY